MLNVLDFRSFDPRFKTGLVFSVFEGLLQGESFKMIIKEDPAALEGQFKDSKINNFKWSAHKLDADTWEVSILKTAGANQEGCCGICGNSKE